jgi:hypothetical protein
VTFANAERARSPRELRQAVDFALVPFVIAAGDEFVASLSAEGRANPVFARALSLLAAEHPDLTPAA